jgi:hypothetical protein
MTKFIKIDETIRYNLDYIYKTEIVEAKVSDKGLFGGGRKVYYVKFYSSVSDKDSWESDYFNSAEEADTWLDEFISKISG